MNARLAKAFWPNEDPVGKQVRWLDQDSDTDVHTVVGVVGDVKQFGLEKDDHAAVYAPYTQRKFSWLRWMNFLVRSNRDAASLATPVRGIIHSLDPALPVFEVATFEHRLHMSLAPRRFLLLLMSALAGLSLVLGIIGIYGVVSYLMLQRRAEFAVRIALGATNRDLIGLVLLRGGWLTGWGLSLGITGSLAAGRFVQHLLFGVAPNDPVVILSAAALVLSVGLLACVVPALRTTRIDPIHLLRS